MDQSGRDFYETPRPSTEALIRSGLLSPPSDDLLVGEPCVGAGAIMVPLMEAGYSVIPGDLHRTKVFPDVPGQDARDPEAVRDLFGGCGLIVTNPPYNVAFDIVRSTVGALPGVPVWMLLRLSFLASQRRSFWMRANTPAIAVLDRRPSFTGDGKTDGADYAWFGFNVSPPTVTILEVLK